MRLWPRSFAWKMTLMAVLASTVASTTLMATLFVIDSISSRAYLRTRLSTLADMIGQNSTAALAFSDQRAAGGVLAALRAESAVVSACLYSDGGALFAQYRRPSAAGSCPPMREKTLTVSKGFTTLARSVVQDGDDLGTLVLTADHSEIRLRWRRLSQVCCVLIILGMLVGGTAGFVLQRRIARPIRDLSGAMQRVTTQQDFVARVPVSGDDDIASLGNGFNSMLEELQKRAEEKLQYEALLQHQALNDELTRLPNRRLLADRLSSSLAQARRNQKRIALLYIDLDGFKLVNDSLGHAVGDCLLTQVAERFGARVRESDTLARLGGDEFALVVNSVHETEDAGLIAKSLLEVLNTPFTIDNHVINISASIGVSLYPDQAGDASQLLQQADSAMYAAKRLGKNGMMYFCEDMGASVRERLSLENELRTGMNQGQIAVHFQPEFEIGSLSPVRFEALARWTHPTLGTIPPGKFIPVAEESGLIVPLGAYILEHACEKAREWQRLAGHAVQVAVNVSSIQFARKSFVDEVFEILRRTGLDPHLLQVEVTESVMLTGMNHVVDSMKRLAAAGIGLAIDDFGTGYSSLGYLPRLPFNALKIDRCFVSELGTKPESAAMLQSIVMMAHNLGMRVIVEGVETQQQLRLVAQCGCNEVQGFLLGRPTATPDSFIHREERAGQTAAPADGILREALV